MFCCLWREDGSVFCICCWSSPGQTFSGPSPIRLATIFYLLRFETSLFDASNDSQGYGGGIPPHLHAGMRVSSESESYITIDAHALLITELTKSAAQKWMFVSWYSNTRNVFSQPLLIIDRLFWLHYSGFQASCHSTFLYVNISCLVIVLYSWYLNFFLSNEIQGTYNIESPSLRTCNCFQHNVDTGGPVRDDTDSHKLTDGASGVEKFRGE
jgi:hypothetical protein